MTTDHDIAFASAETLLDLYSSKALSPVEVTQTLLERLDRLQPQLNAFCVIDRDGALTAARASEERWRRGEPMGALDGAPVTLKDLVLMRGFPTRRGSRLTEPLPDTEDSPPTARLREAGAVILGKTTTPEFGWKAIGDSPLTGITRNPWKLDRTSGGSSAGAAVACAAGIGPLHQGSDGAGSIRIPSAFCGIFGIKATFGRVPAHPPSPMALLSNVGPMTRHVRDAALMLNVLSRPDPRDPYRLPYDDRD
jgi:aspartyl-tRNA(Asn)/glutamyl-tRNA(Gln) amidotransferase subunit A